jgi:hypothetical protein
MGAMVNGAKMGQTVRQSMPFNALYAFMQAGKKRRYGQKIRAFPAKAATYPRTIGVCSMRTDVKHMRPHPVRTDDYLSSGSGVL